MKQKKLRQLLLLTSFFSIPVITISCVNQDEKQNKDNNKSKEESTKKNKNNSEKQKTDESVDAKKSAEGSKSKPVETNTPDKKLADEEVINEDTYSQDDITEQDIMEAEAGRVTFHIENVQQKTAESVTVSDIKISDYDESKYKVIIEELEVSESKLILHIKYKLALLSDLSVLTDQQESIIRSFKEPKKTEPIVDVKAKQENYQKALDLAKKGILWKSHNRPDAKKFVIVGFSGISKEIDRTNDPKFDVTKNNKYEVSIARDIIDGGKTKDIAFIVSFLFDKNTIYLLSDRSIPLDYEIWSTSKEDSKTNLKNTIYAQLNNSNRTITLTYKLYNPNEQDETKKLSEEFTQTIKY